MDFSQIIPSLPGLADGMLMTLKLLALSVVGGVALGTVLGGGLGYLLATVPAVERAAAPWLYGLQAMPKVALAPLLVIWFGFGVEGKVMITSVITFFPLLINSITGYRAVDRDRIDSGRATAPLTMAEGAVHIDTTPYTLEQVIDRVVALAEAVGAEA